MPDEIAHADYAFAFFDAGRPFRLSSSSPQNYVMPQTRYLMRVGDYRRVRYDRNASVPAHFATRQFNEAADRNAPPRTGRVPPNGSPVPYVMTAYPPMYYCEVALAMRLGWELTHHSLSSAFYAARLFNVLLLSITLALTYAILMEAGFASIQRLLLFFAIAALPITSWLFGYIQPDNQATLLTEFSLLFALRTRKDPGAWNNWLWLGAGETALSLTKMHYGIVVAIAVALAMRPKVSKVGLARQLAFFLVTLAIPLAAAIVAKSLLPGGTFGWATLHRVYAGATVPKLGEIVGTNVAHNFYDTYLGGPSFRDFWLTFGIRGTSAFGGSPRLQELLMAFLIAGTILCISAVAIRQLTLFQRLFAVRRRRGTVAALRYVGNSIFLNVYIGFTLLLFAVSSFTNGLLTLQGRYWYPVLAAAFIIAIRSLSRTVPRHRRIVATSACASLALYAMLTSPAALLAMERSFYTSRAEIPATEIGALTGASIDGHDVPVDRLTLRRGSVLSLEGAALDTSHGVPAADIRYQLDGRPARGAETRRPNDYLSSLYNDPSLLKSGFRVAISTKSLKPGKHHIVFYAFENRVRYGLKVVDTEMQILESMTVRP